MPEGWPIYAAFLGFPLWRILGASPFIWPIAAAPMLAHLLIVRPVRVPRGFGIWLLFLAWMLASASQLPSLGDAVFAYRASLYFSATILLVYVYNAPPSLLARLPVILMAFAAIVIASGFLGVFFPNVSVHTPIESILPGRFLWNGWMHEMVHLRFAEIGDFIGYALPRPTAPFTYTNEWGANLALLIPFLILVGTAARRLAMRRIALSLLVLALVPSVMSVNRGMWIAVGIGVVYASIRLALRGRTRPLRAVLGFTVVTAVLLVATPLGQVVQDRLAHPHSNKGRLALAGGAASAALKSPVLGYGGPRANTQKYLPSVGSHGQLWMVLFSHGIPAAALFVGWFALGAWRTRRARSPVAFWCHVVLLVSLVQLPYYGMLPAQLQITMIALALGLRAVADEAAPPIEAPVPRILEGSAA